MAWSSPSKPLSLGLEDSPVSSPPDSWLHSPFTLRSMEEEEQAEMEEAIEDEVRFRKEHGLPKLEEKKEKKKKKKGDDASDDDVVRGDLPPQSPLWDYTTSESSDEPYSNEGNGLLSLTRRLSPTTTWRPWPRLMLSTRMSPARARRTPTPTSRTQTLVTTRTLTPPTSRQDRCL